MAVLLNALGLATSGLGAAARAESTTSQVLAHVSNSHTLAVTSTAIMSTFHPPLLGDEQGNYRIYIVGNSGTGKTTLGAYLSVKLDAHHVHLDQIAWKPGWRRIKTEELMETVRGLMALHDRGWIIDGNYPDMEVLIQDEATDIIWLDPPLRYYLPRLLWRTLMRLLGLRPPCARGCDDTWAETFSRQGIVWYCIKNHVMVRTRYRAWLARIGVEVGGKMRHLDESRGELAQWKDSLGEHLGRR